MVGDRYHLAAGRAGGFAANISIANTGTSPITGWALAISVPVTTEAVSSSTCGANPPPASQY